MACRPSGCSTVHSKYFLSSALDRCSRHILPNRLPRRGPRRARGSCRSRPSGSSLSFRCAPSHLGQSHPLCQAGRLTPTRGAELPWHGLRLRMWVLCAGSSRAPAECERLCRCFEACKSGSPSRPKRPRWSRLTAARPEARGAAVSAPSSSRAARMGGSLRQNGCGIGLLGPNCRPRVHGTTQADPSGGLRPGQTAGAAAVRSYALGADRVEAGRASPDCHVVFALRLLLRAASPHRPAAVGPRHRVQGRVCYQDYTFVATHRRARPAAPHLHRPPAAGRGPTSSCKRRPGVAPAPRRSALPVATSSSSCSAIARWIASAARKAFCVWANADSAPRIVAAVFCGDGVAEDRGKVRSPERGRTRVRHTPCASRVRRERSCPRSRSSSPADRRREARTKGKPERERRQSHVCKKIAARP